jgi:hypothetical protein
VDGWTFTERVDTFLELAAAFDARRLTQTGIDLSSRLQSTAGQPMTSWIADVDPDDLEAFLVACERTLQSIAGFTSSASPSGLASAA